MSISYFTEISIFNLEEAALQSPAASQIDFKPKFVHSVDERLQTASVGDTLPAKECLLRHGSEELASDKEIRLVAQLLNQLMCWRRVEDIVLDGHVLIVELVQQPERRRVRHTVPEPRFLELSCDRLESLSVKARE
jgi:hypothetical protein